MVVTFDTSQNNKTISTIDKKIPQEAGPEDMKTSPDVIKTPGPALPNHIEEYIKNNTGDNSFRDLFEGKENNIDLRSDFNDNEVDVINKIKVNEMYLNMTLKNNFYKQLIYQYMRLKVSFNRLSRMEFVDINRQDRFEQNLNRFNNFANLSKVKE